MKNVDLFRLREGLNDVSNLKGVKFAYVVLKNKKIVEEEIETLQKSVEMSLQFQEFERKRIGLCEQFSEKNKDGSPIIIINAYSIPDRETFESEVSQLKNKYLECVLEREKQLREYDKLLNEESDVINRLSKININNVPDDISATQLDAIKEIIED
jgi:hypothetical protein